MITIGMQGSFEVVVNDSNTAFTMKSGSLDVFATPALVAALEAAAVDAIDSELDDGYTTVGCGISITHTAPTVVGVKVTATATVKELADRRIIFEVIAKDENGIIGEGEHTRAIVNKAKFMSKAIIRSESNVN
ncbi:MAG: hotdog domain-containing protein [Clostridia bacterium]|nr:hotdog domain-containing protein [Clostridia bacterium]